MILNSLTNLVYGDFFNNDSIKRNYSYRLSRWWVKQKIIVSTWLLTDDFLSMKTLPLKLFFK